MGPVRHRSGRQPRRDRRAGDPHAARDGHPLGRRVQRRRRRRPPRRRGRRRGRASARRPRGRATSTSTRSSTPPRAPAPRPSTPATGSSRRTPNSPPRWRRRASCSSGRRSSAIQTMGDKIAAKATVSAFGVPVVPGIARPGLTDDDLIAAAGDVGYPVLVKPSAGGGGKGMRVVHEAVRAAGRAGQRAARGGLGVRRRHPVPRAIRVEPQAHRGAGARRRLRQRRAPRRARMQPAAPPPEGDRGGAVTAAGRGDPGPHRRRRVRHRAQRGLHRRGHRRVHRLRRPARRVLLHGDEHPPAGRAPGHRDGHRRRPRRAAGAHRGGGEAADRPGRHRA